MLNWSEGGVSVYKISGGFLGVFAPRTRKTILAGLLDYEPFLVTKLRQAGIKGDAMVYYRGGQLVFLNDFRCGAKLEPPPPMSSEMVIWYSTHLRISCVSIDNKRHIRRWLWFDGAQQEFNNQVEIMEKVCNEHPNIEKLVKVFRSSDGDAQGVLTVHVDGSHPTKYTWTEKHSQSLRSAIDYLHANGVVHNDIKPSNIRLRKDGEIVLIDFDGATFNGRQDSRKLGTNDWHDMALYGSYEADNKAYEKIVEWAKSKK
ncbi:hypothetical protein FBU59_000683 [Linderina macrospora]|uniref:Uncharacterized protein n=1 Tax=Linderina macrospora TaxID=4868 RepID=A0ACC1JGE2_9FUNG|nr:hypothetical protein FBU59_000683 [Linderina macrospora]